MVYRVKYADFFNGSLRNSSSLNPIPGLIQQESSIALFFLPSDFLLFTNKTDDPWYSAHTPFPSPVHSPVQEGEVDLYMADSLVSALGCVS